jgi:hypothetical protein
LADAHSAKVRAAPGSRVCADRGDGSSIEKIIEDGELTYAVELNRVGKRQSLSIRSDGQIIQPDSH